MLYIYLHSWISQFSKCQGEFAFADVMDQQKAHRPDLWWFKSISLHHVSSFLCCVLWIFPYCMPSSSLWSATWVDKKGLSLPPWDCPLYSTGKVLLFIHVMYPCSCSLSLCGQDGWTLILFLFCVIAAKLFLSPSVTQSFSSYRLRHTANK